MNGLWCVSRALTVPNSVAGHADIGKLVLGAPGGVVEFPSSFPIAGLVQTSALLGGGVSGTCREEMDWADSRRSEDVPRHI